MNVTPVKTAIVKPGSIEIEELLAQSLPDVPDGSVLAVTSKVAALCEGRTVPFNEGDKDRIIRDEADFYLPKEENRFDIYLTIKNSLLIPSAGVDESNTADHFALWPASPEASARQIWSFLKERFPERRLGVVLTDSSPSPLRWGVTGKCLAWCGFKALNSKVGNRDLFGRELKMTMVNVADGLAAAAVLCMGEAAEQTPLAIISDLPFVEFSGTPPEPEELDAMRIEPEDDLFGKLLGSASWIRGRGRDGGYR
jgi:putative folate metabolism gamma-glutamate ligase